MILYTRKLSDLTMELFISRGKANAVKKKELYDMLHSNLYIFLKIVYLSKEDSLFEENVKCH